MQRFMEATGALFSSNAHHHREKKDLDAILEDARLCSTNRNTIDPSMLHGYRRRPENAVRGANEAVYELDGDMEAELQAELSALVERVQSIQSSGQLSHLAMDELLEGALEDYYEPEQQSLTALWEQKVLQSKQREAAQRSQRPAAKLGGSRSKVEKSAASCPALQPLNQRPARFRAAPTSPAYAAPASTPAQQQDHLEQKGSRRGFGAAAQRPGKGIPSVFARIRCSTKGNHSPALVPDISLQIPLSSDSYEQPSFEASDPALLTSADTLGWPSALLGSPSQGHTSGRPPMLRPLTLARGSGSQQLSPTSSSNSLSNTSSNTKAAQQRSLQGSPFSRASPKSGLLAPISGLGCTSVDTVRHSPTRSSVVLPPMGGSGSLETSGLHKEQWGLPASPLSRNSLEPHKSWEPPASASPLARESLAHSRVLQ